MKLTTVSATPPLTYTRLWVIHLSLDQWIPLSGYRSAQSALDHRSRRSFTPTCTACIGVGPFSAVCHGINGAAVSLVRHVKLLCTTSAAIQLQCPKSTGRHCLPLVSSALFWWWRSLHSIDTSGSWADDGQLRNGIMVSEASATSIDLASFNNRRHPKRRYKVLIRALKIAGDAKCESSYESWLSTPFSVV